MDTQDKIYMVRMKPHLLRKKDELSALEQEPLTKYHFLPKWFVVN